MPIIPHQPVKFNDDEGAFSSQQKKRPWRRYQDEPGGTPWNASKAVEAFMKSYFTEREAKQLVLDEHVRATSPLGKSLRKHRVELVERYMAAGMSMDMAIEYIRDYLQAIKEERQYKANFDAVMIELFTYQKRFVDTPVEREIGESVDHAVDRFIEERAKARTWKERDKEARAALRKFKKGKSS